MALLNIFKKGKKEQKKIDRNEKELRGRKVEKESVSPQNKKEQIKVKAQEEIKGKAKTRGSRTIRGLLKAPQITEKASLLQEVNQYVFKVESSASKSEIKKAVEDFYGVDVLGIRVINVPRKSKRLGRSRGWKMGYKKALVLLKKGQTIELLPR